MYRIKSVLMKRPRLTDVGIRMPFVTDSKESYVIYKSLLSPKAGTDQH